MEVGDVQHNRVYLKTVIFSFDENNELQYSTSAGESHDYLPSTAQNWLDARKKMYIDSSGDLQTNGDIDNLMFPDTNITVLNEPDDTYVAPALSEIIIDDNYTSTTIVCEIASLLFYNLYKFDYFVLRSVTYLNLIELIQFPLA